MDVPQESRRQNLNESDNNNTQHRNDPSKKGGKAESFEIT